MRPTQIHTGAYYWGLGASLLTLLTGGWLALAPFALGYQAGNTGGWTDMTQNDFWAGCGAVLVSLAGLVFFARTLAGALRAAGVVRARPRPKVQAQPAAPAPAAAPASMPYRPELEQTMALLA